MFRKRVFWIVTITLVLVASGGGYFFYNSGYLRAQEPVEEETINTYTVTRGDLVISASGSGTLVPASEIAAGLQSGGVLAEVLVEVGDTVETGQVLALAVVAAQEPDGPWGSSALPKVGSGNHCPIQRPT